MQDELSLIVYRNNKTASRKIPNTSLRPIIGKHTQQIGEIAWAWNDLQMQFMLIFALFIHDEDLEPGINLWRTHGTDSAQQQALATLVKAFVKRIEFREKKEKKKFTSSKRFLGNIVWALDKADNLRNIRNAFVHTPIAFTTVSGASKAIPDPIGTPPKFHEKLSKIDTNKLYRLTLGDLVALKNYTSAIFNGMINPSQRALPKRPSLQSYLFFHQGNLKKPPRPKKAHPPQP